MARSSHTLRGAHREIAASTRLTAIFGDPVEHSLSPAMHNAAYRALRMDRRYVAFRVRPDDLPAALRGITVMGIVGVNLTVPHKERALPFMNEIGEDAKLLGAVNCVINLDGHLRGENTDAGGLEIDLRSLRVKLDRKTVLIVGAGGAAASAGLVARRMKAGRVVIANRTGSRALALAIRLSKNLPAGTTFQSATLAALNDRDLLAEARLVINATPMGLTTASFARLAYSATPRGCFFYDMLYARKPTAFLRGAIRARRKYADGAGMLIAQGELAFKLFNGVMPPKGVMRKALMAALGRSLRE